MKQKFTFYSEFWDAYLSIPKTDLKSRDQLITAIVRNQIEGREPDNMTSAAEILYKRLDTVLNRCRKSKPVKKKAPTVWMIDISDKNDLENENQEIAHSFWALFRSNMKSSGIQSTPFLDKAELIPWENEIRLMREKDQRTIDEFKSVYRFLQSSDFWKRNIQSIKALRTNFERLFIQSKALDQKTTGIDQDYADQLKKRIYGK